MSLGSSLRPTRRWKITGGLLVLAAIQLVSFQNCGADFVVKDGLNFESSASTCEASLEAQFQSSYYTFLKSSCADCHTSAGPGQGAFADSNSDLAFSAFLAVGTDKINSNATNSGHAGSYTGPQNASAVTLASQQWTAADAVCKAGGVVDPGLATNPKQMSATATAHDISWNLDTELAHSSVTTGGAKFIVSVSEAASPNGSPVYTFSNPRLVGGTKSVTLTGLMVRINGSEQTLGSTWSRVSATSAAGITVRLSTANLILEDDAAVPTTDTLSMSIDTITSP